MALGKRNLIAGGAVLGAMIVVYAIALGVTGTSRSAAVALLDEPERVRLHRSLADPAAAVDPALANARKRIEAFQPLLAEAETLEADSKWKYLKEALTQEGRKFIQAEWSDLDALLARHKSVLDGTRAAAAQGGPTAALNLTDLTLPHYGRVHELAVLLLADARLALRQNDMQHVGDDMVAIFQLARAVAEEPLFIAHVVSMTLTKRACDFLGEHLSPSALPESQEQKILRELLKTVDRAALADGAMGEAAINIYLFAHPKLDDLYDMESASGFTRALLHVYVSPVARPLLNLDAASYAGLAAKSRDVLALPFPEAESAFADLQHDEESLSRMRVFSDGVADGDAPMVSAYAMHEARVALTVTGMALERHRTETGSYPVSLSAISSRIPAHADTDPFSGQSLPYRQTGNEFCLYSIGPNLTDDGGLHDPADGDMVWRGVQQETW